MIGIVFAIAMLQSENVQSIEIRPKATDFSDCVVGAAAKFSKSSERADVVVQAALAKCRPVLERYVMDYPPGSLAATPYAQESSRQVLIHLARDRALTKVLEIRSQ